MFTGIIQEKGTVLSFTESETAYHLSLSAKAVLKDLELGDSIAVNGCCLTAVAFDDHSVSFDLLHESVRLTSFAALKAGDPVNLETSLRFNGKVGGHFVSGHVDTKGTVVTAEYRGKDLYLAVEPPAEFMKYLIYKGSIAIDGVSLTVAEVHESSFAVWLIPHTLKETNLHAKVPGSPVNLEFDLLIKALEQLTPGQRSIERSS